MTTSQRLREDGNTPGNRGKERKTGWWARNERLLVPYIFISPNIIVFAAFMLFPILFAFYMSFHEWSLIGVPQFNGLDNYVRMVHDELFWQSLGHTVVFTAGTVPTSIALGLAAAMLLNRELPARGLLRSVIFLPVIVSGVVTALVAAWIFNDNYGVIKRRPRTGATYHK